MRMEHKVLRSPVKAVLRMVFPSQCLACGQIVVSDVNDAPGQRSSTDLCPGCWQDTQFIAGLACDCCGAPLPDDGSEHDRDAKCDDCMMIARPWHGGRAAILYSGVGRQLVLTFKHGDRPDLAPALAGWLSVAAAPVIRPGMIVAPVPLHFRRLLKRRYNQSALLARHLAMARGLPHIPDLLQRSRHTSAQNHRGVMDRFANIAGAIRINPRRISRVAARPVLLVDDVMTSGATLAAATEALLAAGSGPVFVAVLARAVKDD